MISLNIIPKISLSQSQVAPLQPTLIPDERNKSKINFRVEPQIAGCKQNTIYVMRDKVICPLVRVKTQQIKTKASSEITSNVGVKEEVCNKKSQKQEKKIQFSQLQTFLEHFAGIKHQLLQQDYLRVCYEKMAMESYIYRQRQKKTAALHFPH